MQTQGLPTTNVRHGSYGISNPKVSTAMKARRRKMSEDEKLVFKNGGGNRETDDWTKEEEEMVKGIFSPDIMLPSQFVSKPHLKPFVILMRAVLNDAIRCASGSTTALSSKKKGTERNKTTSRVQIKALNWASSEDATWPYSSFNICEALGLAHSTLQMWARKKLAELALANHTDE